MKRALLVPLCFVSVALVTWTFAKAQTSIARLTLTQAITQALKDNPDARIAGYRIKAAEAAIAQAKAAFWPQVKLSSNYTRTNNPVTAFSLRLNERSFDMSTDFNHPPVTDNVNMRAALSVPLFTGGRNFAGYAAAKAGNEAASLSSKAVANELGFQTARLFYSVLKSEHFVEAAQSNVKALESNNNIIRKRFDSGAALKSDVLDVSVQLSKAKEDLAKASNANALSKRALATLLGTPDADIEVTQLDSEPTIPEEISVDRHPRLLAARAKVRSVEAAVKQAQAGYWPTISAFANLDRDTGFTPQDESGDSWTAGIMAEYAVWDGMLTSSRVSETEAALALAQEEERKARLDLRLEVDAATLALKEARERLAVSEQAVGQAQESAELTRARYEQGLVTSNQVIDAENALTMARVRRSEAEADKRVSIAAVRNALGLSQ